MQVLRVPPAMMMHLVCQPAELKCDNCAKDSTVILLVGFLQCFIGRPDCCHVALPIGCCSRGHRFFTRQHDARSPDANAAKSNTTCDGQH